MDNYKEMYFRLFNKITDTIVELNAIKDSLMETQQHAEEQFLSQVEDKNT